MISVVVPTLDPGEHAAPLARALAEQTAPLELILVDSGTTDGSLGPLEELAATVVRLPAGTFRHGTARNLGAARARGDVLAFLTQDALPEPECLERLARPLHAGVADAAFARQLPRPDATPLEVFARSRNYPPVSYLTEGSDGDTAAVRDVFFSNSCSAVLRRVFEELGGFAAHTIMNEDMLFASRLLRSGGRIAYRADARVLHSHAYGTHETFRRYFDIGVFLRQVEDELAPRDLGRSGGAYARDLLGSLVASGEWRWLVLAVVDLGAKWLGLQLGRRYGRLPAAARVACSLHRGFWDGAR